MLNFKALKNIRSEYLISISLILLITILVPIKVLCQNDIKKITTTNNSITVQITFENQYNFIDKNGKKYFSFSNSMNEGKPGSPVLPSKTVYIAIPPESKVNVSLSNQQYNSFSDMSIVVNPSVKLINDSTLKYENQNLKNEYFKSDQYPSVECRLLGYTWIRDFYCAMIRINTAFYDWKLRKIKLLLNADVKINYNQPKAFTVNKTVEAPYDSILDKVILNYNYAKNFRSFRKLFSSSDTTGNWIDYSKQYIKMAISTDGIYHIGYSDLINYGVNPLSIDPKSIKIYCKGNELPLFIKSDHSGSFTINDYIEFWIKKNYGSPNYKQIVQVGTDYLNYMDRYTDTTYIYLTWGGQNGERIEIDSSNVSIVGDTLNSYVNFQHFENDVRVWYYDASVPRVQLPFWQENKVWTWNVLSPNSTVKLPFQASNIVPNSKVKTYVRLISYAADVQTNAHEIGIGVNTNSLEDSITFNFKQTVNLFSTLSSDVLKENENTLNIVDLPTSSTFQQVLLDWVDIEYNRYTNASNDSLYFKFTDSLSSKLRVIKISNITVPDTSLILYKVKPDTIKFENFKLTGMGSKTLIFVDTVSGGDAYFLISKNYLKKPGFKGLKKFVNLRDNSQGADDIIISNRKLLKSVTDYNNFVNSNYNIRAKLVYVDDIYDEFSYGYPVPEAIKNFLLYAYENWKAPKPSYLTLIGDANYDYKDFWSPVPVVKKQDLVPSYGFPVSDSWYCMWDSGKTAIPQMFVGRIPVSNDQEVYFYLDKCKKYLTKPFDEWNKTFLFFSGGDPSNPSEIEQLKNENDYVFNSLVKPKPIGGEGYHFYKTLNPSTNFGPYSQAQIQDAINNGGLFISYIGHSGTQTWDNGITNVDALKNSYSDRFPLISDFGCSTGKFAEPDVNCFGELFLSESNEGQAICYLSNSSLGYTSTAISFPTHFYKQFLRDFIKNVGEAHVLAKIEQFQEEGYTDVNKVFSYCNILFGDPLINLRIPSKPNLKISSGDVEILKNSLSDKDNSVPVKIFYHNFGLVTNDSTYISVKDVYNNRIVSEQKVKVPIPFFIDSLNLSIPVKDEIGSHELTVTIDSANTVDEIYENDNQVYINFNLYSTAFRSLLSDKYYNTFTNTIAFLNPTLNSDNSNSKFLFELDTTQYFNSPVQYEKNYGVFYSKILLGGLLPLKRYWWRVKVLNSQSWSEAYSFFNINSNYNWFLNNPIDSISDINYLNTRYNKITDSWELSTENNELKISSAGSSDGRFASIQYNLSEILPNTFFWGIATVMIDPLTLKPSNLKYFTYPNPPAGDSLLNYLKSLPQGTVLAMAVCDDGAQSVLGYNGGTPVRNEIKNWGSRFIDSVRYRDSWCIIGKKGATTGSVREVYKKQFQGIAVIDTNITVQSDSGSILFPEINNSAEWDSLHIDSDIPPGSSIKLFPIGIGTDNSLDTLSALTVNKGYASINLIDAKKYPGIKLLVKLHSNEAKNSPKINFLEVKYSALPELGTNYQVVSLSKDSVILGEDENLQFYVYNVGGVPADSFNIIVDVVNSNNIHNTIYNILVDSLNPDSRREFKVSYNTTGGTGAKSFYIGIDPENKIPELYEDNNVFSIPFFVKSDTSHPTLNVTFDGLNIMNGDYVSTNPKIKIELSDNSLIPVTDTSAVSIFLNGNPVYYAFNQSILSYSFNSANPKYVVAYTPVLQDGEYTLKIMGKNSAGNLVDSAGYIKSFTVMGEPKLLNVYNYPNPFSNDTYFTFKLTQIPDELRIRIFTVAGRLVKEIEKHASDLTYDFNRIYWDGRDQDGDMLANGIYFYKITLSKGDKKDNVIQKMAIVR